MTASPLSAPHSIIQPASDRHHGGARTVDLIGLAREAFADRSYDRASTIALLDIAASLRDIAGVLKLPQVADAPPAPARTWTRPDTPVEPSPGSVAILVDPGDAAPIAFMRSTVDGRDAWRAGGLPSAAAYTWLGLLSFAVDRGDTIRVVG